MNLAFSVVIPTFQRSDVVCKAVKALHRARYNGPIELIVVVDGSTDGTASKLRALPTKIPTTVIEQANGGAAHARNRGAASATGDILLFMDDDMIATPEVVSRHAHSYANGADAVLGHIPLDPASPKSLLTDGVRQWASKRERRLSKGASLTLFDLLTGQLSVKRSLFEELGGFDEAFTAGGEFGGEDTDFGVRLLERARIDFNPNAISYHHYVVTPAECMEQWAQAGRADVIFVRKHPQLADDLYALHGSGSFFHRAVLRPLATCPIFPSLARKIAVWLADRYNGLPVALHPIAFRLFSAARNLVYWSSVYEKGRSVGSK